MGPDPMPRMPPCTTSYSHLDDKHSSFGMESAWSRDELAAELLSTAGFRRGSAEDHATGAMYEIARGRRPGWGSGLSKSANTAYITFDEFASIPESSSFYQTPPTAEEYRHHRHHDLRLLSDHAREQPH